LLGSAAISVAVGLLHQIEHAIQIILCVPFYRENHPCFETELQLDKHKEQSHYHPVFVLLTTVIHDKAELLRTTSSVHFKVTHSKA
jgi:hypothetical protein